MCVCTYIFIYIYIYIYIHTHIHTYVRTYTHTYIHNYIHTYIHTYIHICVCIYIYIYMYMFVHGRPPGPCPCPSGWRHGPGRRAAWPERRCNNNNNNKKKKKKRHNNICIHIIMLSLISTGVCEKTLLRRRIPLGRSAWETQNRGLESSCRCWVGGQRLTNKQVSFHRHW